MWASRTSGRCGVGSRGASVPRPTRAASGGISAIERAPSLMEAPTKFKRAAIMPCDESALSMSSRSTVYVSSRRTGGSLVSELASVNVMSVPS